MQTAQRGDVWRLPSGMRWILFCVVLLCACSGASHADHTALIEQICRSPCAGPHARVALFEDGSGTLKRARFDGDLELCSHPPRIYYDASGAETLTIPNRPVTGDEEAARLHAQQEAQTAGLTEAETLRCPGE
jgi:hypothetical protein